MTKMRWYEHNPVISQGISYWAKLPLNLQQAIGEAVILLHQKQALTLKNPGWMPVTEQKWRVLYQFTKKRRWYDSDETLQKAFGILSNTHQLDVFDFAHRLIELGAYIEQRQLDVAELNDKEVKKLVNEYVLTSKRHALSVKLG